MRGWGIGRGDRVAILSENRPEWTIADFASLLLGAVTVPIYATLTAEQTAYILRDSGRASRFCFDRNAVAESSLDSRSRPRWKRLWSWMRSRVPAQCGCKSWRPKTPGGLCSPIPTLAKLTRAPIAPDDLATIIYTSGTTGTPKGVMLTHGNMASNLNCSLTEFPVQPGDVSISFLPLSHVTARHVDFALLYRGVTLAHLAFVNQLPRALLEVKPTFFVAVPRVYEKIHFQTEQKAQGFPNSDVLSLGAVGGAGEPSRSAGGTERRPVAIVEAGGPAAVFEGAGGTGRAD